MSENNILENFKQRNIFILFIVVVLTCSSLIIINYLTIKILSSSRAYVNGESNYSKGQKDAARYLVNYIYTEDINQWKLFKEELSVPQGGGLALINLMDGGENAVIKNALRQGRNHEEDLNDMIWLFNNFKEVSFLKKAINEWEKADLLILEFYSIAANAYKKINAQELSTQEQQKILQQINTITDKLTINERNFSNALGEGTRLLKTYLLYTNIFFTLFIIGSVSIYYHVMINRLTTSKLETEDKNKNLILANEELDKFVYSASHDLRSPISSLKGLIEISKIEDDPVQIKNYLDLMEQSLDKQDLFIREIIDYSRVKKKKSVNTLISLKSIIDEAISQHLYIEGGKKISIEKKIDLDEIFSDGFGLKIILNNLLSNAIKYTDETKAELLISIRTYVRGEFCIIEIEDNGIGIKKEHQSNIFNMFFVTQNKKTGSGLGLYIAKEAAKNLQGSITVESEINIGTKFTLTFPQQYEA